MKQSEDKLKCSVCKDTGYVKLYHCCNIGYGFRCECQDPDRTKFKDQSNTALEIM